MTNQHNLKSLKRILHLTLNLISQKEHFISLDKIIHLGIDAIFLNSSDDMDTPCEYMLLAVLVLMNILFIVIVTVEIFKRTKKSDKCELFVMIKKNFKLISITYV